MEITRGARGYTEITLSEHIGFDNISIGIQPNNAFSNLGEGSVYLSIWNTKTLNSLVMFLTAEEAEVLELALYDARVNGTNGWNLND